MRITRALFATALAVVFVAGCGSAASTPSGQVAVQPASKTTDNSALEKAAERGKANAGKPVTSTDTSGNKYPLTLTLSAKAEAGQMVIKAVVAAQSGVNGFTLWVHANGRNVRPLELLWVLEPSGLKPTLDPNVDPARKTYRWQFGALGAGQVKTFKFAYPGELVKAGCAAVQIHVPGHLGLDSQSCPSMGIRG